MAQPATSCSLVSCVWQQSVRPQNATDRRTCFGYHVTEHLLLRTYANFRLFAFLWKLFSVLKAVFLFNALQYRTEFDAIFTTPQTKKLCFFSQRLVSHYCLLTVNSAKIVILRFCCAKILGYRMHSNFSTNFPTKDRIFLKKLCSL